MSAGKIDFMESIWEPGDTFPPAPETVFGDFVHPRFSGGRRPAGRAGASCPFIFISPIFGITEKVFMCPKCSKRQCNGLIVAGVGQQG